MNHTQIVELLKNNDRAIARALVVLNQRGKLKMNHNTAPLQSVTAEQAYEWVKTGAWSKAVFVKWFRAQINHAYECTHEPGGLHQ